jgi:hypothetical protein
MEQRDPTLRQPGRKSAFTVVSDSRLQPLPPPAELSPDEKAIWIETVERMRPGWFAGSEAMLEMFCRAVCFERRLAGWLKRRGVAKDPRSRDLVSMHKTEAMLVANLATRLRLTVRSSKDRYAPKLATSGPRVWLDDDPEA